jgi:nitroreductase
MPTSTTPITPQALLAAQNWRYATKAFDPAAKLSAEQWQALAESLRLSPSSFGLQLWRFVNVTDTALRAELRKNSWGQSQVTDASHLVVFTAKENVTQADIQKLIDATAKTRGLPVEKLDEYKKMMVDMLISSGRPAADTFAWTSRQVYIALGNLMTSAAVIGVDSCPIEGLDAAAYDRLLGLEGSGYRTLAACALGVRSASDKYAGAPKVRYPMAEVVVNK